MNDLVAKIESIRSLRSGAATPSQVTALSPLDQFRADFKAVLQWWRTCGEISQAEMERDYAECSAGIRAHQHDATFMAWAMAFFRDMAVRSESDRARAARIRQEVRSEKEAARCVA